MVIFSPILSSSSLLSFLRKFHDCHHDPPLPALFCISPQLKSVLGNLTTGKVGGHYENCILALKSLALDFQTHEVKTYSHGSV